MKKYILLLPVFAFNCFAQATNQFGNYSFGVGLGAMYTGLGANISYIAENDLKYISAGCGAFDTRNKANCGFGAGWMKTDLFGGESTDHAFGVIVRFLGKETYVSRSTVAVGRETYVVGLSPPEGMQYQLHENDVYGAGVSYTYFVNGIADSGTNFGISLVATNSEVDARYDVSFQIGYQF